MKEELKKSTAELMTELQNTQEFVRYYNENGQEFLKKSLPEDLAELMKENGLRKADVIRDAEMSDVYAYQIFSGLRRPDRNKIIMLLIAMHLSFEEVQTILKRHGYGMLYPRNEFDCVVTYGICHRYNVPKINEMLYDYGLPILE